MIWNPTEGIELGPITIRFYSLMFVIAFALGWLITKYIFNREKISQDKLDTLFVWVLVATLLGARLGHVFFYDWEYFKNNPLEILLPIKLEPELHFTGFTGLASHGATIAILGTMYFYSKNIIQKPMLWILDRIVVPIASGAVFVRIGNFMNSEIYGNVTNKNTFLATKFIHEEEFWKTHNAFSYSNKESYKDAINDIASNPKYTELINQIPYRFPAQLYEAIGYVFVFILLFFMYWKTNARNKSGLLFGTFLILLWSIRFFVENIKQSQGGELEKAFGGIFSTGQWLSIPFIILGFILIINSFRKTQK